MGNCCGSQAGAAASTNNVQHRKGERLANWKATGVIGLRAARLKELPSEVAEVPSARVLDASDNRIVRLPPNLPGTLQRVVMSNNQLDSLIGLDLLLNLKVLVLDGNRIAYLPDFIGSLTKLETLSLSDNLLSHLPPSLGSLRCLRQLLVSQNKLKSLPAELGDCESLEELDGHHNTIHELPESLARLQRLKLLQLDSNVITAIPPAILRDCTSLATISLHGNPITPDVLQSTEGYEAFEARRQGKYTKSIATGVLLGRAGMDEGIDR